MSVGPLLAAKTSQSELAMVQGQRQLWSGYCTEDADESKLDKYFT